MFNEVLNTTLNFTRWSSSTFQKETDSLMVGIILYGKAGNDFSILLKTVG